MEEEIKKPTFLEEIELKKAELDRTLKELDEKIKEAKELKSIEILSGRASAGRVEPVEVKETPKEYANRMLRGG